MRSLTFPPGTRWEAELARLAAVLAGADGDDARTLRLAEEGLRQARAIGDGTLELRCLNDLAVAHAHLGDVERGSALLDHGLALATEEGHATTRMILLANAGAFATRAGHTGRARDRLGRALALAERHDNVKVMGLAHLNRGRLERQLGDARAAWSDLERARDLLEAFGHVDLSARTRLHVALSSLAEGDLEAAASHLDGCLTQWWEAGLVGRLPDAVRTVAALAARRGDRAGAARLWRAADTITPGSATRLLPSEWACLEAALGGALEEVREADGRRHDEAQAASTTQAVGDAIALAREHIAGRRRHVLRVRGTSAA